LKSVGFTITRAPFDSFHSVAPMLAIGEDDTILPLAGTLSMSALPERLSVYAMIGAFAARSNTARRPPSVGTGTPSFSGVCAMITRF